MYLTAAEIEKARPEVVPLCRCDGDEERIVGWAMMLPERVVTYVRCRDGRPMINVVSSLARAERILDAAEIYPLPELVTPGR